MPECTNPVQRQTATYKDGIIVKATWEATHVIPGLAWQAPVKSKPYVKVEVKVARFEFHGRVLNRLFKAVNVIVPLFLGFTSPMKELEKAVGVEVHLNPDDGLVLGQEIPELAGKLIRMELVKITFKSKPRLHIRRFLSCQ